MPKGLDCLPVSASTQMRDRSFQVPNNGLWPGPMGDHLDDEVDFMHRERHQECTALSVDPRAVAWARRLPRHHIAGNTWAWIGTVSLPEYGSVRLVVATNGQGGLDYIVSNDLHRRGKVLLHRKRSRWDIESCFRDTKQLTGLSACQCRVPQAMERHVALVLLAFVVLQQARHDPSQTVGESKRSLHLRMICGGEPVVGKSIGHSTEGRIMPAA